MNIDGIEINANIYEIVDELSHQLRMQGSHYLQKIEDRGGEYIQVCCPYHKNGEEKRPSSGINKKDGFFHCFACNSNHSLIELISYCFGYDDIGQYGFKWIMQHFSTVSYENRKDIDLNLSRDKIKLEMVSYVSEKELDSYRYIHPYMYKRKLTDSIIEKFDVGYDKDTQCLTFPVRDLTGGTLFIARRSVNTKYFNYPSGAVKPVYGLYELPKGVNDVIICESIIDALTCWSWGKPAVALNGTGNSLQFLQLNNLPVRHYILATDNDEAGMSARKKLRAKLKNKLVTEYVFPDGVKDINDMTKEQFDSLEEIF